jgi:transposase-like protein
MSVSKIWLNLFASILVILMIGASNVTYAQAIPPVSNIDTEPIDLYLEITKQIKYKGTPDPELITKYFKHPIVSIFVHRPGFDSVKFVNNLITVYSNKPLQKSDQGEDYLLMMKYAQSDAAIRKTIASIKQTNIDASVKQRLKAFYPSSIHIDTIKLQHVYMFLDEGNGGLPGYVLNSALQTSYLPNKQIDVISAHEAYHTITYAIFLNKFKILFAASPNDTVANNQNLISYIQIVAEEGIADLIDKKSISSSKSALAEELKSLQVNEVSRAQHRVRQLDSLLSYSSEKLNFLSLDNIKENGGHIPGRYMAKKIKEANLLQKFIPHTGNPFQFFYLYNEAVKNQPSTPKFSDQSITLLKALETRVQKL